jgi:hypothetical protein
MDRVALWCREGETEWVIGRLDQLTSNYAYRSSAFICCVVPVKAIRV